MTSSACIIAHQDLKYDRKSRTKRTITYFPLVALFFLFAGVVLFWTGAIISALHDQDGTNTSLAELHDYLSCSVPTLSGSASSCAKVLGENWKDSSLAPFLVTTGLVIAVRILLCASHKNLTATRRIRWSSVMPLSGGESSRSTLTARP